MSPNRANSAVVDCTHPVVDAAFGADRGRVCRERHLSAIRGGMNAVSSETLDLIGRVYQAGLEPDQWPGVIREIASLVDARSGTFHFVERSTGRLDVLGSHGFDPAACREYREHYHRVDQLTEAALRLPPERCVVGQHLVDQERFERSEIYLKFLRPLGMCHCMGGLVLEDGGVAALIGFQRPEGGGPFDQQDADTLGLLLPHLARAALVHRRMTQMHARVGALASISDHWPTGVILTDADGTVVWCNRAADGIVRDSDGLRIHRRRLTADHPETNRTLRALLRRAAGFDGGEPVGGGAAVPRRSLVDHYSVLVAPLQHLNGFPHGIVNRPLAVVFLGDPAHVVTTPAEALRRLYSLTPAEARLAEALMAGSRLRDAAGLLSITEGTARSYLKRVLRKVGARCQSDLIRIVLSGVAPLASFGDTTRRA